MSTKLQEKPEKTLILQNDLRIIKVCTAADIYCHRSEVVLRFSGVCGQRV